MIDFHGKTSDEIKELLRKARAATFKNLGHAGAALRRAAQRKIRRSKEPSEVGTPPHTARGALKNSILYAVEGERGVVIGPSVNLISDVAAAHEHGLPQKPKSARGISEADALIAGTNWKMYVGGHGPIGDKLGTVYIKFKSPAQVDKSLKYIFEAPDDAFGNTKRARLQAKKRRILAAVAAKGGTATYPKRPFMGPTLTENLDRLPSVWAGSVR